MKTRYKQSWTSALSTNSKWDYHNGGWCTIYINKANALESQWFQIHEFRFFNTPWGTLKNDLKSHKDTKLL